MFCLVHLFLTPICIWTLLAVRHSHVFHCLCASLEISGNTTPWIIIAKEQVFSKVEPKLVKDYLITVSCPVSPMKNLGYSLSFIIITFPIISAVWGFWRRGSQKSYILAFAVSCQYPLILPTINLFWASLETRPLPSFHKANQILMNALSVHK